MINYDTFILLQTLIFSILFQFYQMMLFHKKMFKLQVYLSIVDQILKKILHFYFYTHMLPSVRTLSAQKYSAQNICPNCPAQKQKKKFCPLWSLLWSTNKVATKPRTSLLPPSITHSQGCIRRGDRCDPGRTKF